MPCLVFFLANWLQVVRRRPRPGQRKPTTPSYFPNFGLKVCYIDNSVLASSLNLSLISQNGSCSSAYSLMFHQAPQQRLPKPPPRHERPEGRAVSLYQLDHVLGKATSGTSQGLKIIFFQNPSDSRRVFSEQNEEFLQGSRNVIFNLYSLTLRKLWQILH